MRHALQCMPQEGLREHSGSNAKRAEVVMSTLCTQSTNSVAHLNDEQTDSSTPSLGHV